MTFNTSHDNIFNILAPDNDGFSIVSKRTKRVTPDKVLCKTKPCNFAIKNGTCKKSSCPFAHTLEELKDPMCNFDNKCKKDSKCQYRHSSESRDEWVKRTNYIIPNLPSNKSKIIDTITNLDKVLNDISEKRPQFTRNISRPRSRSLSKTPPEYNIMINSESDFVYSDSWHTYQTIRVQTEELAKFAIKEAFDRGQYNLRVIIEK